MTQRVESAANEGSSAMAAASSGGEADELIGEVAKSEVDEMDGAVAATSGGGEASEAIDEATQGRRQRGGRKKKSVPTRV